MSILEFGGNMDCLINLSQDQQVAYLKVLSFLSKVDGDVDDMELAFIEGLARLYGINDEELCKILNEDNKDAILQEAKLISDRRVKLELIKDMCIQSYGDNVLEDIELMFIGEVGQVLDVELEKVEQISRWVIDRIIWLEEAKIIFEEV